MPQPAAIEAIAEALVDRYRQAIAEWQQLLAATKGERPSVRLRDLQNGLDDILDRLNVDARQWVATQVPQVWSAGADVVGVSTSFTQAHLAAIQTLANQDYDDLLKITQHVRENSKRALRRLAKAGALDTLGGQTANAAGKTVTDAVQDATGEVMMVTYRNGAEHSLADWADTAVRTQTAKAYNEGTLGGCRAYNVKYVELADGPGCGLTAHDDPELADGLIVPIATAEAWPLAHPRCARSILPRADITSKRAAADANDSRDMETLRDRALAERQRAARSTVTGRRFTVASERSRVARRQRAGRAARQPRAVR